MNFLNVLFAQLILWKITDIVAQRLTGGKYFLTEFPIHFVFVEKHYENDMITWGSHMLRH